MDGDDVAIFAKVRSPPTHVGFETLATIWNSDFLPRLNNETTLASNIFVEVIVIRISRVYSGYARVPHFYFLSRPEDAHAKLGNLRTFSFCVRNSEK